MKKKIAVFATGWSEQMIFDYMNGVQEGIKGSEVDLYTFMCFPAVQDGDNYINGELNIFKLPNLHDFDGALVLANTIDYPEVLKGLEKRCEDAGIPAVFTGYKSERNYFVGTDNYSGARTLCEHLYDEHGIRDFFFIAGSRDNLDSNTRLQALKDVISEHGGIMPDESVFYSDWNPRNLILFIREWMQCGKKLPGAFVCANDELAVLLCNELRDYRINVPNDVAVTGFDNMMFAQVYVPSISSVSQRFDKIGFKSASLLMDVLAGKKCEKEYTVLCEFEPGESCGCKADENVDFIRKELGRNMFMESLDSSAFYRKLSIIDRFMMMGDTYEDIKTNYMKANDIFNYYEGKTYHIMLDPIYREKMNGLDVEYNKTGFSKKMDVMLSLENGEYNNIAEIHSCDIVPTPSNPDDNHLFICLPMHDDVGNNLGYAVFSDDYKKFKHSEFLGKYVSKLSDALIKYQQTIHANILNNKLMELSETDALTHVKNRMAFQGREEAIDKAIASASENEFAIILCDINNLKYVNDKWGHEKGDEYIKNCCSLICKTFKHSAVYRIGGDEFVVIADGDDYYSAKRLVDSMETVMYGIGMRDIPMWDKISFASGLAVFEAGSDKCMADVLKRADEEMYNRKIVMKAKV